MSNEAKAGETTRSSFAVSGNESLKVGAGGRVSSLKKEAALD
jgi:hypothetical protein